MPSNRQFSFRYAAYLHENFPRVWRLGGNIRGNKAFQLWRRYRRGQRTPAILHWWEVERPAWIARHYHDHRIAGVIAQVKWGAIGTLGVREMKRVIEEEIRKRYWE